MPRLSELPQRFKKKVIIDPKTKCWIWTAGGHGKGYGGYSITHDRKEYAHRFAFEFFFGPIPQHLQCDHLCRMKRCVNPSHLELVTGHINTMRGMNFPIQDGKHCQKGHPLFGRNLYMEGSTRRCRICGNERMRRYQQREKERHGFTVYHNKHK